jgi:hypothetical protein
MAVKTSSYSLATGEVLPAIDPVVLVRHRLVDEREALWLADDRNELVPLEHLEERGLRVLQGIEPVIVVVLDHERHGGTGVRPVMGDGNRHRFALRRPTH